MVQDPRVWFKTLGCGSNSKDDGKDPKELCKTLACGAIGNKVYQVQKKGLDLDLRLWLKTFG